MIPFVVLLALVKMPLVDAHIHLYCYYVNLYESTLLQVYVFIYTAIVHSSRLYTLCILAMLI